MKSRILILSAATVSLMASCDVLMKAASTMLIPTNDEIISGLKEALVSGITKGTGNLNKRGAFLSNAALKILLPPEVKNVESKIRGNAILNGLIGGQLDKTVQAMNDGAEDAMGKALPIFKDAVMKMSFADAMGILKGGNSAATNYLKQTTTSALHTAFKPTIQSALDNVKISEYWTPVVSTVNKYKGILGLSSDINPDLTQYVTERATSGLFTEIEKQENAIRSNPAERTSALLKKVFDYADSQKGL